MKHYFLPLFSICFTLIVQQTAAQSNTPPNILFIMSDDHTSQSWGIYDGVLKDYVKNENIKRMAANGAVLNNAFCVNSICVPSRATILTGEYSNENGVYTLDDPMPLASDNIAKQLQKAGYQTALFGKWHLKTMPQGFDTFRVLPGHGVYFDPTFLDKSNWNDSEKRGTVVKGYNTDIITDMSIDWMRNRDVSRPFFLMTHFKATHEPFEFADRHKDLYKDVEFPYPISFNDSGASTTGRTFRGQSLEDLGMRYERASKPGFWTTYPELPFSTQGLDSVTARKKIYQKFIHDFLRCSAGIDDNLGRILDHLAASGLDKNTVIIYTSDQGYFLGEHDFFDKRLMYEESLRMPFVICYPKEIKGGTRVNDIILNIDFAALFADYAGIKKPASIQGKSFRENLEGNTPKDWRKDMYYRYWQHREDLPAHFGIRNKRYKLIFFYGQPLGMTGAESTITTPGWEFFDLEKDPNELHNAINDKEYKGRIKKMKRELKKRKLAVGDDDKDHPVMKEIMDKYW